MNHRKFSPFSIWNVYKIEEKVREYSYFQKTRKKSRCLLSVM